MASKLRSHAGSLFAALFVLALALSQASAPAHAGGRDKVPPEAYDRLAAEGSVDLILSVQNSDALSAARQALQARGRDVSADLLEQLLGARLALVINSLPDGITITERFDQTGSLTVTVTTTTALDALEDLPNLVRIDLPQVVQPLLNQSLGLIHQPDAAAAGYTGAGTSVAVLDTGVDYTRAAFGSCTEPGVPSGCRVAFADDFTWFNDGALDDGNPKHGTHVAGIVAGVAPEAQILSLDVFVGSRADDAHIMGAISWVIDNAAEYNIKAVNLSVGTAETFSPAGGPGLGWDDCPGGLQSSFQALRAAGILPVVAAGNSASDRQLSYPGCIEEAHAVGATYDASGVNGSFDACTDNPTVVDTVACFSNSHATMLDSLAPGARISSAGLNFWAGTSMATPHVAGAVAVLSTIVGASLTSIENALKTTGPEITDPRNGVVKRRLDVNEAALSLGPAGEDPPDPPPDPPAEPIEIVAATTQDFDKDGFIDRLIVRFAERLNDNFSGLAVAVDGYAVESVTTNTPLDDSIFVWLRQASSPDTGATPLLTIVSNSSLGQGEKLVGPPGATFTASDKAGPAIVSAETRTRANIHVHFSEPLDASSVQGKDFRIVIEGTQRLHRIVVRVDSDTFEIQIRNGYRWAPGSTGTIQLALRAVKDAVGISNLQTAPVAVDAGY
jgi:subtilisin family serine protease